MNIIPAIDILGGRCVRLYQGDYEQTEIFNDNPVDVAKKWVDQGATKLHLVDLDAAKAGKPVNQKTIEAIVKAVDVPVQVGGGLRNYAAVADVLALGVVEAAKQVNLSVPLVVRLAGTNFKEGKEILDKSNLKILSASDLNDAAKKIVGAIK